MSRPRLCDLDAEGRAEVLAELKKVLSPEQLLDVSFGWREEWGRPEQLAPMDRVWRTFLYLGGRGTGKTRSGAEWVREEVDPNSLVCRRRGWSVERVGLIAPTAADCRDVVIEGEGGIMATSRPDFMPKYEPSKRRLTWPNGATATTYGAEEPDRMRGPQHGIILFDELAAYDYPETYELAMLGLRLGKDPRCMVTTTPKPTDLIRTIKADPNTYASRGSTYDNKANLPAAFFEGMVAKYKDTRIGLQEIMGELLEDDRSALWTGTLLDATRIRNPKDMPLLDRVVVAVDPSAGDKEGNDEQGICAAGEKSGHIYVLQDSTCKLSPEGWSRRAINLAIAVGADCIYGERNCGGDMVKAVITATAKAMGVTIRVDDVTATRGKHVRAEPIAALWEQQRGHLMGIHEELEKELVKFTTSGYTGKYSPNRADAMVWACTALTAGDQRVIVTPNTVPIVKGPEPLLWVLP